MSCQPSLKPYVDLPVGAGVRKVGTRGQSNAIGIDSVFIANQNVPLFMRAIGEHVGTTSKFERLGSMFREVSARSVISSVKKQGFLTQASLDLVAAGKSPICATIARGSTSITEFLPGGTCYADDLAYSADLAATAGASDWHWFICWGEADGSSAALSAAYQTNLTAYAAQVRGFFPGSRFYVLQLNAAFANGASAPDDVNWPAAIRAANVAFVAGDGNAELIDPAGWGFSVQHYTKAGYISGGSAFAARVLVNQP